MSKAIRLKEVTWNKVFEKIKADYPPSTFLIRSKMQTVLGFSQRVHTQNVHSNSSVTHLKDITYKGKDFVYSQEIQLDFYSEAKRTMFLLKYSDILNEKDL